MSGLMRRMLERLPMRRAAGAPCRAVAGAPRSAGRRMRRADRRERRGYPEGITDRAVERAALLFAPDVAAHFDSYWATVDGGADASIRDFSVPARHYVPALGVHLWQSGLIEEIDTIQGYLGHSPPCAGETVFDLGANCGASVLVFSRAVGPAGRVVAFEPDPLNREMLKRNVESLALSNVIVSANAVAGRSAKLRFNSEGSLGAALSHVVSRAGLSDTIEVDALTLADACAAVGASPDFIKMDVEGAEEEVIEGARDWLRGAPPSLGDRHTPPNRR